MIVKYFKSFVRHFGRNKLISSINLIGLVLGLLSTLLILEYVFFERSYDSHHKNADNIYRIVHNRYNNDGIMWRTCNYYNPSGPYLKKLYPEIVQNYVTMARFYDVNICYTDNNGTQNNFVESKTNYSNSNIFDVFSLKLLSGNKNCLDEPYKVAISERAAKKMFGAQNAIGKSIIINYRDQYVVSGVYKTIPSNTHLKTDFLFSLQTRFAQSPQLPTIWINQDGFYNYLLLKPGTDYKKFEKNAFPKMIADNYEFDAKRVGYRDEVYLQPLRSIHLYSNLEYEAEAPVDGKIITILFWFSLFFLLVVWINYVNLTTAQSVDRAKEVGVKKANGASLSNLVLQFISESAIFNIVALIVSVVLFLIINPYFTKLIGITEISSVFYVQLAAYWFVIFIIGLVISVIFPAYMLSSFNPLDIFKGQFKNSKNGNVFRKVLITIQFIITIVFLTGTIIAVKQVKHLTTRNHGINFNSKIAVNIPRLNINYQEKQLKVDVLTDKLNEIPEINATTFTSDIPGQDIQNSLGIYRKEAGENDFKAYFRNDIDYLFKDFFGIKLYAGRFFEKTDLPKMNYIIVNQSAAKRLGFYNVISALNQTVIARNMEFKIIGIVRDFSFMTLKVEPVPTVFTNLDFGRRRYLCARYNAASENAVLEKVKKAYTEVFPSIPFEYSFINQKIENELVSDKKFIVKFSVFAILAIIISIIGILGLILIMINRNVKEMGIRKTNGAKLNDIAKLLFKGFIWEFAIATTVAIPICVFGFSKWFLSNYIYRVELNWTYYAIPIFILLVIQTVIIYAMAYKIMKQNTIESLRYE